MTDTLSQVSRHYDDLASTYDRRWHRYLEETLTPAIAMIEHARPLHILDMACGTGEFIRRLLAETKETIVIGIDGSGAMLKVAQEKFQGELRVTFQQALADSLPFQGHLFDWVVSCNSFHCFQRPDKVFSEMMRVLKPGGKILVLDWCRDPWHCRLVNRWFRLFDRTHVWMYTTEELSRLAMQRQMTIRHLKRFRIAWPMGLRVWEMMMLVGVSPG